MIGWPAQQQRRPPARGGLRQPQQRCTACRATPFTCPRPCPAPAPAAAVRQTAQPLADHAVLLEDGRGAGRGARRRLLLHPLLLPGHQRAPQRDRRLLPGQDRVCGAAGRGDAGSGAGGALLDLAVWHAHRAVLRAGLPLPRHLPAGGCVGGKGALGQRGQQRAARAAGWAVAAAKLGQLQRCAHISSATVNPAAASLAGPCSPLASCRAGGGLLRPLQRWGQ